MNDSFLDKILNGEMVEGMRFCERAWAVCSRIPAGKVATYATIAEVVCPGRSRHFARAIGQAMRTNPLAPRVPCHRVVAADLSLNGYSSAGGLTQKYNMLRNEGVRFIESGLTSAKDRRVCDTSVVGPDELRCS